MENLQSGLRYCNGRRPVLDGTQKGDLKAKDLEILYKALKDQSYGPIPAKSFDLAKSPQMGGGQRHMALPTLRDKVVEAAIYLQLEPVVDPTFSDNSYGFRRGRGCHDALNSMKYKWQASTWVMTFDICKCFDTVNHKKLLELLKRYCDQATLELITKLLKVGYINMDNLNDRLDTRSLEVPQGSILAPLLANIYLNQLDLHIEKLQEKWTVGKSRRYNPDYNKVTLTAEEARILEKHPDLAPHLQKAKLKELRLSGNNPRTDPKDPEFTRLYYVRYADDFVIGMCSTKEQALEVQKEILKFLEEELLFEVSRDKSRISHCSARENLFLGVYFRWSHRPNLETTESKDPRLVVPEVNNATFTIPVERLLLRATDRGFATIRKAGTPRATSYRKWTGLEDQEIIRRFSAIIRGLYNYYSCCNQRSDLWPVLALYRKACALTLADKHKLKTSTKVYKKYGPYLKISDPLGRVEKSVTLFYPESLATNIVFKRGKKAKDLRDIDAIIVGARSYTRREILKTTPSHYLAESCQFPGCHGKDDLEDYPLPPQRNLFSQSPFDKWLLANSRKTVTLCKKHHQKVDHNIVDRKELPLRRGGEQRTSHMREKRHLARVVLRRGEIPKSIFGHPEVYICASVRCLSTLDRKSLAYSVTTRQESTDPYMGWKHPKVEAGLKTP